MTKYDCIFFDRDGTINNDSGYISKLSYFKHDLWFAEYNKTASASDTYNKAEASLFKFLLEGW